jgi:multiple sugar transport system substrate-binding protein
MKKVLAAAAAVTLMLGGCTQQQSSGQADTGPIRLLVSGSPDEINAFRTLIDAYQKANAGTEVQLLEASNADDLVTKLSTSIAGGAPPDIFLMNYRLYGQFASKNAVDPAEERLKASKVIKASDFYPQALTAFRWGGKQLCMPQNVSSLQVYYNKALFAKYNVPEPKDGWTWNEFVATAQAMTRDAAGNPVKSADPESGAAPRQAAVHGAGSEPTIVRLSPFVWSNGGKVTDNDQKPARIALDDKASLEALRNFVDLRLAYGVVPSDVEVKSADLVSRFTKGQLAMLLESRRITPTLRNAKDLQWDVVTLPRYGNPANVLHSDAYCITSASGHKDAAWRFIEFAMSPNGQKIIAGTGRTVPSHIETSKSEVFLDPAKAPKNAKIYLDVVPHLRPMPTISTWSEIEDAMEGILENALYRGDKLDSVLAEMEKQTKPMFQRGISP